MWIHRADGVSFTLNPPTPKVESAWFLRKLTKQILSFQALQLRFPSFIAANMSQQEKFAPFPPDIDPRKAKNLWKFNFHLKNLQTSKQQLGLCIHLAPVGPWAKKHLLWDLWKRRALLRDQLLYASVVHTAIPETTRSSNLRHLNLWFAYHFPTFKTKFLMDCWWPPTKSRKGHMSHIVTLCMALLCSFTVLNLESRFAKMSWWRWMNHFESFLTKNHLGMPARCSLAWSKQNHEGLQKIQMSKSFQNKGAKLAILCSPRFFPGFSQSHGIPWYEQKRSPAFCTADIFLHPKALRLCRLDFDFRLVELLRRDSSQNFAGDPEAQAAK